MHAKDRLLFTAKILTNSFKYYCNSSADAEF